jgi:hypothetical protein
MSCKITTDPSIGKDAFMLSKDRVEIVRGALNELFSFLADFPNQRYDEIAVHPDNSISHISATVYTARRLEQNRFVAADDL